MQTFESEPEFRNSMSPPSSEAEKKPSKKPAWKQVAGRAVSMDYMALYRRR
jgi:hypothetical protein